MILTDTGPLVALFDPADGDHARCKGRLRSIDEALVTTVPVLTEAFHLLRPDSPGARGLMTFVVDGGLGVWFLDTDSVIRSFELMDKYATSPMDLADASLVAAAERLGVQKIFTLDRKDFSTYRIRRGHRHAAFEIVR
ncbi:MAG: PIN domain-containing protein [Pseudomonadota bacterium]